jgi:hypothetical protein
MQSGDVISVPVLEAQYVNVAGDTMTGDLTVNGKNPYPIGGVYFQLPGQAEPALLFVGNWSDISASFAGVFFRVAGGNASAFESGTQAQDIQSHTHIQYTGTIDDSNFTSGNGQFPPADGPGKNNTGITTGATGGTETRPINVTIRVWKRMS